MKRLLAMAAVAHVATARCSRPDLAQDVAAGRAEAVACQTCHGLDGIAKMRAALHLAAQPACYLEQALRAFRIGERRDEVMNIAARGLTDDDIRNPAAYYAAIRIEVIALPK